MSNAEIFVKFSRVGFHCWPLAPGHRSYLTQQHRHRFDVKASCEVTHDDREIEFHDMIDFGESMFADILIHGDISQSCEAMARELARRYCHKYKRAFSVTVGEDEECGATVIYAPDGDI